LLWSGTASAALYAQPPAASPFTITGFVQAMTLDNPADVLSGGTVTVNGIKVIIPKNTVIVMSASNVTWQELWAFSPCPWGLVAGTGPAGQALPSGACTSGGNGQTGLALADAFVDLTGGVTKPLTTYEITILGNRIGTGSPLLVDYVAGVVYMAQQSLNVASGFINFIDYATGTLHVGGQKGVSAPTDTLIQINDPVGRFGRVVSPDPRWTSDTDNPTIHAKTGYPMCIPRAAPPPAVVAGAAPPVETDPLCPQRNRPLDPAVPTMPLGNFTLCNPGASMNIFVPNTGQLQCAPNMPPAPPVGAVNNAKATVVADQSTGLSTSDATNQAPLMVGDAIDWSGTLQVDPTGAITGTGVPNQQYISAYNIEANLGIYTAPGATPAYLLVEVTLLGVGGTAITAPIPVAQESTTRIKTVGFFTDPQRQVDLYAVVPDPCSGVETEVLMLGSIPNKAGGVPWGRWRDVDQAGLFPITRQWRARYHPIFSDPNFPGHPNLSAANGLDSMTYTIPVAEFITPENTVYGDPTLLLVPNNFQDFPFLTQGEGPWRGDPAHVVGQLEPFPLTNSIPGLTPSVPAAFACPVNTAPTVVLSPPNQTVAKNSKVSLNASASHSNPLGDALGFLWTQLSGPPVALSGVDSAIATFQAPNVGVNTGLTFQVTVTDLITRQSAVATTLVIVSPNAVRPDSVAITAATYKANRGILNVSATSSDTTCAAVMTVQAFASNGTALLPPNTNMLAGGVVVGGCGYTFASAKAVFPPTGTTLNKITVISSEGGAAVCPNGTCTIATK
ncbi:MAG: PKD domain-containing protein, partial [Anaeromyxobacteraceae bacterium]